MQYDKIITCYFLKIMKVKNYLNLLLENMLELIVYLKIITKIRFKTPMLRSNLCDYCDAYILVIGTITVTAPGVNNNANNIRDKRNIIKKKDIKK